MLAKGGNANTFTPVAASTGRGAVNVTTFPTGAPTTVVQGRDVVEARTPMFIPSTIELASVSVRVAAPDTASTAKVVSIKDVTLHTISVDPAPKE